MTQETIETAPSDPKERLKTAAAALEALNRAKCQCGARKQPKRTFCGRCFARLPHKLKAPLYSRIGRGYEAAWIHALEHLRGECKCHL